MSSRLSRAAAVALYDSGFWRFLNAEERACLQLKEDRMCMPFSVFHAAVEVCLQRRVHVTEYLRPGSLLKELAGDGPGPRMEDILELVPQEKLPLLVA